MITVVGSASQGDRVRKVPSQVCPIRAADRRGGGERGGGHGPGGRIGANYSNFRPESFRPLPPGPRGGSPQTFGVTSLRHRPGWGSTRFRCRDRLVAARGALGPRATRAGAARGTDSTKSGGPPGDFRRCRATDEKATA